MITVAFIPDASKNWLGGVYYFKNLFYAISTLSSGSITPVVFFGKKTDENIVSIFKPYAKVIRSSVFDRWSFFWFSNKLFRRFLGSDFLIEKLLIKNSVDVLSHSSMVFSKKLKVINWIPDFQHMHLPEMFSKSEIVSRNKRFFEMAELSDKVILSSNDALNDYISLYPQFSSKAEVLHFVSQPDSLTSDFSDDFANYIKRKYKIKGPFFYVPNQFWKHKNHLLLFKAVSLLKQNGIDVTVLCSGQMADYRNKNYIDEINAYIATSGIDENVKILGLIDYSDVFSLMRLSVAVVNPSLFEGWSSTVEECKSIDKLMLLSDIAVHKEQSINSIFFIKDDVNDLAEKLKLLYFSSSPEVKATEGVDSRTFTFAQHYENIVTSLFINSEN